MKNTLMTSSLSALLAALGASHTFGEVHEGIFSGRFSYDVSLRFLIHLPVVEPVTPEQQFPLILFLHGAGERGDNLNVLRDLGPLGYAARTSNFPFIVLAPQCPLGTDWSHHALIALLDHIQSHYPVDAERVYITGYSMGGHGTWDTAFRHSERFAAVAPLCGRVIPLLCGALYRHPIWVFHGAKDDVVPIAHSNEIVDVLRGMGNERVRYTVYDDLGHDIWTTVYAQPALYDWFLEHHRPVIDR